MTNVTPTRKFGATAALFALAVVCVGLAAATHRVWPLFVAWLPLLSVAWVLTRPEPGPVETPEATPVEATPEES
jgi:hypothetical protein